jgi:hypothetical protein
MIRFRLPSELLLSASNPPVIRVSRDRCVTHDEFTFSDIDCRRASAAGWCLCSSRAISRTWHSALNSSIQHSAVSIQPLSSIGAANPNGSAPRYQLNSGCEQTTRGSRPAHNHHAASRHETTADYSACAGKHSGVATRSHDSAGECGSESGKQPTPATCTQARPLCCHS